MNEGIRPPEIVNKYGPEKIALVGGPSTGKTSWLATLPYRIVRMNENTPSNVGYTLGWSTISKAPLSDIGDEGSELHSINLSKEPRWTPQKPVVDLFGSNYAKILKKHGKETFSVNLEVVDAPGAFIQSALIEGSSDDQKTYIARLKEADKIIFFINPNDQEGERDGELFSKLISAVDPAKIVVCMVKADVWERALDNQPSSSSMMSHYRTFRPKLSQQINPDIYKVYFATNWGKQFYDNPHNHTWISRGVLRPLFDHLNQEITTPNKLRPFPNDRFHKWDFD